MLTLPLSLGSSSYVVGHPFVLVRLVAIGVMSIVLGFAFELQALRRITPHTAGMLFALDPAVGFVFGLLVLYQSIGLGDLLGMSWLWSPQRASRSKS